MLLVQRFFKAARIDRLLGRSRECCLFLPRRRPQIKNKKYPEDGLHGLSLLREIHQWSPQAKIIVISAFGTSEVKEAAMMEGIDRFYDKPFEIMEIRNALVEMLPGIGKISTKN